MHPFYSLAILVALASALPSLRPKPKPKPLPLIIWHGLGDRYDAEGLQSSGKLAQKVHPGTYVYYIRTDDDGSADRTNTFFGNVTTQLAEVCEAIHNEPGLVDPDDRTKIRADALGFSQGGQFLRGLVETCEGLSVRSLVTFGSQHNGIAEFQECGTFDFLCKGATGLIKGNAWTDYVQGKVVPAQYYRTVNETTGLGSDAYLKHSNFLAHVNNEREVKVERFKEKIAELEMFVMYVFKEDVTVVPKETGWFAEVNATTGEVTPLRERKMYKEDWLGLKKLDEKDGLVFRNTTGGHMELSDKDLIDAFTTYFGPEREDEDVVEVDDAVQAMYDFPGYCEWVRTISHSAYARAEGDDILAQLWLDESNILLEQMRAEGFAELEVETMVEGEWVADWDEDEEWFQDEQMEYAEEGLAEDVFDIPGYADYHRALIESVIAGKEGNEIERQLCRDKAKNMLEKMHAEGYFMREVDSVPVSEWDDAVEYPDSLEEDSWVELDDGKDCAADEAQAWWDSLSWWERVKFEWEMVWLPWWRGELKKAGWSEGIRKAKGDL